MSTFSKAEPEAACGSCSDDASGARPEISARVAWLQYLTIAWMLVECSVSLVAAARAHSVALLAFGSDSLVELLSAIVVLLQFLPRFPLRKQHAERASAVLLFLLAVAVVVIAALSRHAAMETSPLGIAITAAALAIMPILAVLKRKQSRRENDRSLAADAMQSATCAYLAAVTLAGLLIYSWWRITWVDSLAALAAVPVLILEGRRAWRGDGCGCSAP